MSPSTAKMAHLPLSRSTTQQLRERGRELREMAKTARLDADIRALEVLAARFESLAEHRGGKADRALPENETVFPPVRSICTNGSASRAGYSLSDCGRQFPPCPEMPAGADFAEAWQLACQHVSQRYVFAETMHHPVVISECYDLACMLIACGLVPGRTPLLNLAEGRIHASNVNEHHVIVVDDVADVLVSVGAFLVNAGFPVQKAANGDEALRAIANDPSIDVLVTDFAMPGLNGADLIGQATQIRPSLKAVVITGYPNADGLADLPAGTTVLMKPFRRDALVAAVKSSFDNNTDRHWTAKLRETV